MMFIKKSPNSHGFVNPRDIEQMWRDQFDWVYREYDYAVFPMTIHPDVSGRPQVLMMLERLYHHMIGHPGVRFVTMNEMADDFARRLPRKTLSTGEADDVRAVRRSRRRRALDRRRRATRRLHPQHRSASAPARAGRTAWRAANRVLQHYGMTLCRLAGRVLRAVDGHRQDRDRRQSRPSLGRGRAAARPAVRSARSGTDRRGWRREWLTLCPTSRRST